MHNNQFNTPFSPKQRFEKFLSMEPMSGCWLWTGAYHRDGYGAFCAKHYCRLNRGRNMNVAAHRASWMIYVGPIPEGLCVLHRCDVKACVNPLHLFLGTKKDNSMDSVRKGRWNRTTKHLVGSRNHEAKISEEDVIAIRKDTRSHSSIGKDYGLGTSQVARIRHRESWRHIP